MQQNIKGLLLLIFLIVFSFVSFQYFNNDDAGTVSVPSTTSTTTTTVAVVEIEPYNAPAFNLEEIISSSLEKIDIVCERVLEKTMDFNAVGHIRTPQKKLH